MGFVKQVVKQRCLPVVVTQSNCKDKAQAHIPINKLILNFSKIFHWMLAARDTDSYGIWCFYSSIFNMEMKNA